MNGWTVAARSITHRVRSMIATALAILGTTLVIGCFAGLAATGLSDGVPDESRELLLIMGLVMGAWGAILGLFALTSTFSLAVRRRGEEVHRLRSIGATPAQVRGLIRREAFMVGLGAALVGGMLAGPLGRAVLRLMRDGGIIAPHVGYAGGGFALGVTVVVIPTLSAAAAHLAAWRLTTGTVRSVRAESLAPPGISRWRVLAGVVLVTSGLGASAITLSITRHSNDPYAAMATSGNAGLLVAVGLTAFAPRILIVMGRRLSPAAHRLGSAGQLAVHTLTRRGAVLGPVFGAAVTFAAATVGVLMMTGIDRRTFVLPPGESQATTDTINLLNGTILVLIAGFCLLVLINVLLAVIDERRPEYLRLGIIGATRNQICSTVAYETVTVTIAGGLLGVFASSATVVPFSVARQEGVVPDAQLWLAPLVVVGLGIVTTAVGVLATRREIS